jgi:hypothetical protein
VATMTRQDIDETLESYPTSKHIIHTAAVYIGVRRAMVVITDYIKIQQTRDMAFGGMKIPKKFQKKGMGVRSNDTKALKRQEEERVDRKSFQSDDADKTAKIMLHAARTYAAGDSAGDVTGADMIKHQQEMQAKANGGRAPIRRASQQGGAAQRSEYDALGRYIPIGGGMGPSCSGAMGGGQLSQRGGGGQSQRPPIGSGSSGPEMTRVVEMLSGLTTSVESLTEKLEVLSNTVATQHLAA